MSDLIENLSKHSLDKLEKCAEAHGLLSQRESILYFIDKELSQKWKYISYPDFTDKNFYKKIYFKEEFHQNIYDFMFNDDDENEDLMKLMCPSEKSRFKLTSYQIFLKNYLNINTPYNGILLFHGLGSGKSCSAITIAETYKKTFSTDFKKIMVLVSNDIIENNFKEQIHDVKNSYNQCTFSEYMNYYPPEETDTESEEYKKYRKIMEKKSGILIDKYYDFKHYGTFANLFNKKYQEYKDNIKEFHKWIKINFSNRVVIIDEVHNLKALDDIEKATNPDKAKRKFNRYSSVMQMVTHAENIKLILLSGTPMSHEPREIIDILNLLLENDNYKQIPNDKGKRKTEFFDGNSFKLEKERKFKEIVKGYISFLRKENPLTFAERKYPKNSIEVSDFIAKKFKDEIPRNLLSVKRMSHTYIVPCPLSETHKKSYLDELKQKDVSKTMTIIQYGIYDIKNHRLLASSKIKNGKKAKYDDFALSNLEKVSSKIHKLITNIRENPSKGPIFIYSNWVRYGIVPIALALMRNGITLKSKGASFKQLIDAASLPTGYTFSTQVEEPICYKCANISTKCTCKKFERMYFEILGGTTSKERQKETLDMFKDRSNINGKNLKILVGSEVLREGVNMKYVRQVHILEPWHNKSRIDQIIGRSLRRCSHVELPPEERNVEIFQYASILNSDYKGSESKKSITNFVKNLEKAQELGQQVSIEVARPTASGGEPLLSYDIIMYKRAQVLDEMVKRIEKMLKESAVDCAINKKLNNYKVDEENEYECDTFESKQDYKDQEIDTSTFNNIFLLPYVEYAMSVIKDMFKSRTIIYKKEILKFKEFETDPVFQNGYIIEKALYELCPKPETDDLSTFYHIFKIDAKTDADEAQVGYIIPRMIEGKETVYIFQPLDSDKKVRSEFEQLPMYHRRGLFQTKNPTSLNTYMGNKIKLLSGQPGSPSRAKTMKPTKSRANRKVLKEHMAYLFDNGKISQNDLDREAPYVGVIIRGHPEFWIRNNADNKGKKLVKQAGIKGFNAGDKCTTTFQGKGKKGYLVRVEQYLKEQIKQFNREDVIENAPGGTQIKEYCSRLRYYLSALHKIENNNSKIKKDKKRIWFIEYPPLKN